MNDNKTIAINTIVLTIKMVINIVCSFIVSRLILKALGADNYGLYNVVGGIVGMLALISTSMVTTTYRYIAVERGKGESGNPQKVYSTLMFIHVALAILLLIVGEPLGAYYIFNFLNVTNATLGDAHFVFIFSLIASFFTVIAVPSNGLLIAEEKFVPISIIEVIRMLLNVAMAFSLLYCFGNRLRMYAVLMAVLTIANRVAFQLYCKVKYPEVVKFKFNKNKQDYKEIFSFTGWTLLGASAVIGRTQGVAMVINLFFRNSINAAFGVATQLGHATGLFTNTLRQSVTPQIMKNQDNNPERSLVLVYAISRYTYLIMLVMAVPLVLSMDYVLEIWLGKEHIPSMTSVFAILLIFNGLITNLGSGFEASIQATGKIRKMQIGYTIINLSIIPIVYILYKIGLPAYMNVVVGLILTIVTVIFEATIMREQTDFNYIVYLHKTILPTLFSTVLSFLPMIGLKLFLGNSSNDIWLIIISVIWTSAVVFLVGIDTNERVSFSSYIRQKLVNKK